MTTEGQRQARPHRGDRPALGSVLTVLALAYAAATLWALRAVWTTPTLLDDDARMHLLPFVAAREPAAFLDRFLVDYSEAYLPIGYRVLLSALTSFAEPLDVARALGLSLLLALWVLTYVAGRRIAGAVGGALALALAVHAEFLVLHTFGGLYRAFGFVLAMAWATTRAGARAPTDRLVFSAWLVAAMALFYPPLAIVCGLALLLEQRQDPRGPIYVRTGQLAATAIPIVVAVGALWAVADKPAALGPVVSLGEASSMPAFSREGGRLKLLPMPALWVEPLESIGWGLHTDGDGPNLLPALIKANERASDPFALIFALGLGGGALLWGRRRRWWLAWLVAALLVYYAARVYAFRLGFPDRALKFTLPILVPLLPALAWAAAEQLRGTRRRALRGLALALAAGVFLVYPYGTAGPLALAMDVAPESGLIQAVAEQTPPGALLTGWPDGPAENLPLLARRELMVNHEHAHPLYHDYFAEVDERLADTLRLLFATSIDDAREIRDRRGLTHLVLQPELYDREEDLPRIFRPYDQLAADLRATGLDDPRPFLFEAPSPEWVIYADTQGSLIDLAGLGGDGTP